MQFTWDHIHYLEVRPYQNVNPTSGFQATAFTSNILHRYNVNLQTAVTAILVFVECPKPIAFEVVVVLRPYQNVKSIREAFF